MPFDFTIVMIVLRYGIGKDASRLKISEGEERHIHPSVEMEILVSEHYNLHDKAKGFSYLNNDNSLAFKHGQR